MNAIGEPSLFDTALNGFSYRLSMNSLFLIAIYSMKGNGMKNILHPQKHTAPQAKITESKLETATDDRHMGVTPEQRHQMIAEAAYRRAQKRSFVGGNPENDWYEAEAEIGQLFSQLSELHNEPQH
jgi:hypothetical protein